MARTDAIKKAEEFLKVREELEDYEDLRCLREAKQAEKNSPAIGMDEVRKQIGNRSSRSSRRR